MKIELPEDLRIAELQRTIAEIGLVIDAKADPDGTHRARWAKPTNHPRPEIAACTQPS